MPAEIYLGEPPSHIKEWIRKHYTHIKFVDGTEDDYLLEGNVDWEYLVGKGLMQ